MNQKKPTGFVAELSKTYKDLSKINAAVVDIAVKALNTAYGAKVVGPDDVTVSFKDGKINFLITGCIKSV